MTAKQVVQEFCDLMVKRDAELLRPYLDDSVVYQNVGMAATTGIEDVIANVAGQLATCSASAAAGPRPHAGTRPARAA